MNAGPCGHVDLGGLVDGLASSSREQGITMIRLRYFLPAGQRKFIW